MKRVTRIAVAAGLLCFVACQKKDAIEAQGRNLLPDSQVVILESAVGWTPTQTQRIEAETKALKHLQKIAAADNGSEYLKKKSKKILDTYHKYRLQIHKLPQRAYMKNCIHLNYIPMPWILPNGQEDDPFPNWKTELIGVQDGGIHFWQIEYNVVTKKCQNFSINYEP